MPIGRVIAVGGVPFPPMSERQSPAIVLIGNGQDHRDESPGAYNNINSIDPAPRFNYLRWKIDADNEMWFGAHENMVTLYTAEEADANVAHQDGNLLSADKGEIFFRLWPGQWRISASMLANKTLAFDNFRVFRISSTGLDEMVASSTVMPLDEVDETGSPVSKAHMLIPKTPPIDVSADDIFYVAHGEGSDSQLRTSQWMELEYLGPHEVMAQRVVTEGEGASGESSVSVMTQGPQGPVGPKGDKGGQGDTGPQGEKGDKGDTGDTGATGAQGTQGIQGIQGIKGDTGSQGPTGGVGPQGATGEQGLQGPKGDKGDTGDAGADGADGADGATGPAGPNNPTLVLWGSAQASRMSPVVASNYAISGKASSTTDVDGLAFKWLIDTGELWFDATADMVDILSGSDAGQAGLDSSLSFATTADEDGIFFKLDAGKWRFSGQVRTNNQHNESSSFGLFKIRSGLGDDDLMALSDSCEPNANLDRPGRIASYTSMHGLQKTPPIAVTASDIFYIVLGVNHSDTLQPSKSSQYLELEYLGA